MTLHGPACRTVTVVTLPDSSYTWVMPIFFPSNITMYLSFSYGAGRLRNPWHLIALLRLDLNKNARGNNEAIQGLNGAGVGFMDIY